MFEHDYKIKFSDCDPGGVVYFAEVFDIAHQVYEEFLLHEETGKDYFKDDRIALPLIKAEADYKMPVKLHEVLKIELTVSDVRESSFEIKYDFFGKNNYCKVSVRTVHVCIDKSSGTKTALPGELSRYLNTNRDQ